MRYYWARDKKPGSRFILKPANPIIFNNKIEVILVAKARRKAKVSAARRLQDKEEDHGGYPQGRKEDRGCGSPCGEEHSQHGRQGGKGNHQAGPQGAQDIRFPIR